DEFYDCPEGDPENPLCIEYRGDVIIESQLGIKRGWYTAPLLIISADAILFYILGGLFLKFKPVDIMVARSRAGDDGDASAGKEKINTSHNDEVRTIDVTLEDVRLEIVKKGLLKRQRRTLQVLKGVSTHFAAGQL